MILRGPGRSWRSGNGRLREDSQGVPARSPSLVVHASAEPGQSTTAGVIPLSPQRTGVDAHSMTPHSVSAPSSLSPAFAGAAATLSGIGLARFAYVPLFPVMVAAGWVTGAEGGFLGAVNLAGYLIGVLGGRTLAQRLGTARALDIGMGLAALAFAACAWNGGVRWRPVWGTVVGFGGGGLFGAARARGPGGGSPA